MASFDEVVPPGTAGTIKASIHTANFKGPIGKSITVTHDDKTQGPITVSLLAKIVSSVDIFPFPALQIGRRRRGFETPAELLIRKDATEQGTLEIGGLVASAPWLTVNARTVSTGEPPVVGLPNAIPGDVVLSVQAKAAPVGNHLETIKFTTGLTRQPQVTIPVTVSVQPAVTLQPNELILNPTTKAESASGSVLVSVREDLDPKTVTVASESPSFVVRVDPPGARAFRLTVDWSGDGEPPGNGATLHIRVGEETLDVPVRFRLASVGTTP